MKLFYKLLAFILRRKAVKLIDICGDSYITIVRRVDHLMDLQPVYVGPIYYFWGVGHVTLLPDGKVLKHMTSSYIIRWKEI